MMQGDTRHRNANWVLEAVRKDKTVPVADVQLAILMDLRDELQTLNRLLRRGDFIRIPSVLDSVERNTRKRKPKQKRAKRIKP